MKTQVVEGLDKRKILDYKMDKVKIYLLLQSKSS